MSVYLIATVRVDDPETYKKYTAKTPALIEKHGGRFLARGGAVEAVEGEPFVDRMVLVEFPSREHFDAFHGSPEYQEAMKFRHASSESRFLVVEGVTGDGSAPDPKVVKSGC